MFAFIIKRILQATLVMFIISFIAFAIKYSLGDPTRELLGISASEETRQELREELGIDQPFLIQWKDFLIKALKGDLGNSYFYREPALKVIMDKFPATMELVLVASFLIIFLSIPFGIYAACRPNTLISRFIMSFSTLGVSIPVFLTSMILIYIFSIKMGWFPSYGRGEPVHLFGSWTSNLTTWSNFQYLILPSLSLSSVMLPLFIRLVRSEMIEALSSEYVRYATAKGLSKLRIIMVHAFRNTLLPLVTVGGIQLGTMLAFTILTETVFQWPGMGFMFIEAVSRSDSGLLVAYLVFTGFIFVVVNTCIDILYTFIDPTISIKKKD
ncbi:MAG: ABC transporter permease [Desulfovibrionaceae bacterium]